MDIIVFVLTWILVQANYLPELSLAILILIEVSAWLRIQEMFKLERQKMKHFLLTKKVIYGIA